MGDVAASREGSAPPNGVEWPASDPPPEGIDLDGGRLVFIDEGPKGAPALIALHGIPGSGRDFRYLAPQLSDTMRVLRLDLPGFGGSEVVDDAISTLAGRARVVLEFADRLGLERFVVLGHSMGGGTALLAAARAPTRIELLVLVASVGLTRHQGLGHAPWVFRCLAGGVALPLLGRLLLPSLRAEYQRRRFPGADGMTACQFALQLRAISALDFGAIRRAASIRLPQTLVAFAEDDPLVETQVSHELAQGLPHSRVLAFESGGHNLQKTRAPELAEAIRASLKCRAPIAS